MPQLERCAVAWTNALPILVHGDEASVGLIALEGSALVHVTCRSERSTQGLGPVTKLVKIVAILTARPGKAEALRTLLDGMVLRCRSEPGNLRWDIWEDQMQSGRYVLDELYRDGASAIAHRETPHFKYYVSHIGELADRTAVTLNPADVAESGA